MTITFGTMLGQTTGIFALLAIGFMMNRLHLLPKETEVILSRIGVRLFYPALLLNTFMEECTWENLMEYGALSFYGCVFQVVSIVLAVGLTRFLSPKGSYLEGIYRYALAFPYTGGFGNPIILALFGQSGFFQFQLYLLFMLIFCYSWGVSQLMPAQQRGGWRKQLHNLWNPAFLAIILGAVLGLTGMKNILPAGIHTTLQNLGSCYTTTALLLAGFVIGDYGIRDLARDKKDYLIAVLRLIVIPGVFLLVLRRLQVPEMLCILTCMTFACPCGMNTVVYPAAYGEDTRPGASLALITCTLAVFTMPLLLVLI